MTKSNSLGRSVALLLLLWGAGCDTLEMPPVEAKPDGGTAVPPVTVDSGEDNTASGAFVTCASSNVGGSVPTNLIVLLDTSFSMVNVSGDNVRTTKWDPVVASLKTFFGDAKSTGHKAALTRFPVPQPSSCDDTRYATPNVALTALPNAAFGTLLDSTTPEGQTPSRAALTGALNYAKGVATGAPDMRAVLVLITDGAPGGPCSNNTFDSTAQVVAAAAAQVKTYVIGIGTPVAGFDTIAAAGGTSKAFAVPINNVAATTAAMHTALGGILAQGGACSFTFPAAPAGKTVDPYAIRFVYSPAVGAPQLLTSSNDCAGDGWRYDNPLTPTRIDLCDKTCATVKADKAPKFAITMGCKP